MERDVYLKILNKLTEAQALFEGLEESTAYTTETLDTNATLYVAGKVVSLVVKGWTTASNITIPESYRPSANQPFVGEMQSNDSSVFGRVMINADGSVGVSTGTVVFGTFTWILGGGS